MSYMLEIKDIHKTFNAGTINEKVALNGVNLNLNEGDFVTIIGETERANHHIELWQASGMWMREALSLTAWMSPGLPGV